MILSILPSASPITAATCARLPGSFSAVTAIFAGKRCGVVFVDVPGHVDPALWLLVEGLQRFGVDRIDGDALAWIENADDAVAGDRAVLGEAHRQVAAQAPDRDAVRPRRSALFRLLLDPGQRNLSPMTLPRPNQPSSARFTLRRRFGVSLGVSSGPGGLDHVG